MKIAIGCFFTEFFSPSRLTTLSHIIRISYKMHKDRSSNTKKKKKSNRFIGDINTRRKKT